MDLEKQVPPWELCRDIPAGSFADSALVWISKSKKIGVIPANFVDREMWDVPAPTLPELLAEIGKVREAPTVYWDGSVWTVECEAKDCIEQHRFEDKENPANAALKLWLEVAKNEVEDGE